MNKNILFYDPFGNIVYENKERDLTKPFYNSNYAIRSIVPHRISETYFVRQSVSLNLKRLSDIF